MPEDRNMLGRTAVGAWLRRIPIPVLSALIIAGLVAWGMAVRLWFLLSTPEPLGVDGYYYAVQLRSLLQGKGLYYPSAPLAFWLLAPFAWLFGPIAGVKVGAALGTALGAIPAYALAHRVGCRRLESFLAAALVATSSQSLLLASEFVKQGLATTLLLVFLALLGAAQAASPRRRSLYGVAAALALAGCALTHKLALGIAVFFLVCFMAVIAIGKFWERLRNCGERKIRWSRWIMFLSALLALSALLGYAIVRFIPAGFGKLLETLFSARSSLGSTKFFWHGEAWLAGGFSVMLVLLLLMIRFGKQSDWKSRLELSERFLALLAGPLLLGLFIPLPWLNSADPGGLGPRLLLLGFVSLCVTGPAVLALILTRVRATARFGLVGALLVILLLFMPQENDRRGLAGSPAIVSPLEELGRRVSHDSLLLTTENRISFQATWVNGLYARMRAPVILSPARTFRLLVTCAPFAATHEQHELIRRFAEWEASLPQKLPPALRLGRRGCGWLLGIPEPTWQAFLAVLDPLERGRLDPWAALAREWWLTRGN